MRAQRYWLGFAGTEYLGDVRYGVDPYGPRFTAKMCRVVKAHIEIQCMSAPGAGEGLSLTLTVGGQDNLNPSLRYGAPKIDLLASVSPFVVTSGGAYSTLATTGKEIIEIRGFNFGRNTTSYMPYVPPSPTISGFVDLESVTYGRLGHEYVAQNCSTFYTDHSRK